MSHTYLYMYTLHLYTLTPTHTHKHRRRRSRLSYSQKMKAVHFLQMHLEDDTNDLQENELVYSPVLIWKPGKQPHTHHHTHPPRYHTCTPVHVELLDHSSEGPSIHPTETRHSSPGRSPSPTDNNARKSPLHMNRTDLTLSLPPRDSSSELLNKMVSLIIDNLDNR